MTISENKITEFYEYLVSEEKSPKTILLSIAQAEQIMLFWRPLQAWDLRFFADRTATN